MSVVARYGGGMQQLGTRVVEDTLENRIEKALADAGGVP
jgi:carbon monoxide dehydrogenase subunit G